MSRPIFIDDEAFRCLRAGDMQGFKNASTGRSILDFSNGDFRSSDLRGVDLTNIVLRGAYLKSADLRGADLRQVDLEGASLHDAKVGGALFPDNLDPMEIMMSLQYGTRLRTMKSKK